MSEISSSYLLRLQYPTQTLFCYAYKHISQHAEPGAARDRWRDYVSTPRVRDWLAAGSPTAPDGRHFLCHECNVNEWSKKWYLVQMGSAISVFVLTFFWYSEVWLYELKQIV